MLPSVPPPTTVTAHRAAADIPNGGPAPIVTLTLNPALDVSLATEVVVPIHKLRTGPPLYQPGGGGINVSRVCRRLGEPTVAVLPLGGPSGARIADLLIAELDEADVRTIPIRGDTRESISIMSNSSGDQYRFVLPGPTLTAAEVDLCLDTVAATALDAGSRCVAVSGSVPDGVALDLFARLVNLIPNTSVLVDTSGPALTAALRSGAHLVKPSARELAATVDRELLTEADIIDAARQVKSESDVDVIVVSIGPGGAVVVTADDTIRLRAPTVQVRSSVGAGDSMVAGIAAGLNRHLDLAHAVALGVAAGTATVLTDGTDLCNPADVDRLIPLIG